MVSLFPITYSQHVWKFSLLCVCFFWRGWSYPALPGVTLNLLLRGSGSCSSRLKLGLLLQSMGSGTLRSQKILENSQSPFTTLLSFGSLPHPTPLMLSYWLWVQRTCACGVCTGSQTLVAALYIFGLQCSLSITDHCVHWGGWVECHCPDHWGLIHLFSLMLVMAAMWP